MMEYVKDFRGTPCPFCGSKRQYVMRGPTNIEIEGVKTIVVEICCHMCGSRVHSYDTDSEYAEWLAMEKWNHRAEVKK